MVSNTSLPDRTWTLSSRTFGFLLRRHVSKPVVVVDSSREADYSGCPRFTDVFCSESINVVAILS